MYTSVVQFPDCNPYVASHSNKGFQKIKAKIITEMKLHNTCKVDQLCGGIELNVDSGYVWQSVGW